MAESQAVFCKQLVKIWIGSSLEGLKVWYPLQACIV
jgi:hypothetical protein